METAWVPLWTVLNVNLFLYQNKKEVKSALNSRHSLLTPPSSLQCKLLRNAPGQRSIQLLLIFLFLNSLTLTAFNWIVCSGLCSPVESRHRPVNAVTSPLPSTLVPLHSSNLPWKESRQSHNMTHSCLDWTRSTTLGLGFTHITSRLSIEDHWLPATPW